MKKYYMQFSILFIVSVVFIFLPFWLKGNSFINRGDSFNQLYPAFVYSGYYVRDFIGNLSDGRVKQYDFTIGFGDDIIGTLNYYGFGSLFSLISASAPAKYSEVLYTFAILLKFYLSGLAFSYSLFVKCKEIDKKAVMVAAFTYVFSTYSLFYGLQFSNFMDVFVYLPLAVAGIEKVLQDKNKKIIYPVFIFAFWAQALSGFYHLYMLSLFCVIYFAVRCLTQKEKIKFILKKIWTFIGNYLISLSLASTIFLPSIVAYFNSTRSRDNAFSNILFSLYDEETVITNLTNVFLKAGYQAGLGIGVISGLAIIMLTCRKGRQEYKILLSVFGIGYFVPAFGSMMNGFAYATDRWIFMLIFLLCAMTAEVLSDKGGIRKKEIGGFALLALAWSSLYWISHETNASNVMQFSIYASMWISVLIIACILQKRDIDITKSKVLYLSGLFCVMLGSFVMNAPVRVGGSGWSAYFMPLGEAYKEIVNSGANIQDEGYFRVDTCDSSEGSSLVLHTCGTNSYYSIVNKNIFEFFREMKISSGINNNSFRMTGLDNRDIIRKLLAVKYMKSDDQIIQNLQYEGLGILFDSYCLANQIENVSDVEKNLLIDRTIILNETLDKGIDEKDFDKAEWVIKPLNYRLNYVNAEKNNNYLSVKENGNLKISVKDTTSKEMYLVLKGFKVCDNAFVTINLGSTSIKINSEINQEDIRGDNNYLIYVGKTNDQINIQLEPGNYELEEIEVYGVDYNCMTTGERQKIGKADISTDINRIQGVVDANKNCLLFLSIPYSEGWKIYLDGEKVKKYKANYGFMAIEIPSGEHIIEAEYHTPGLRTGMVITGITFIAVIIFILIQRKWRIYENTDAC